MAIKQGTVTVTTSATPLNVFPDSDNVYGSSLAIHNSGTSTVYVGGPLVTTSDGYPVAAGADFAFDLTPGDALYGVAAGAVTVNVLASGV